MLNFCIKYKVIFAVLLFGMVFYLMNTIIPFYSDDIWLSKDSGDQDSFFGIIVYLADFAWHFWNNENGRIVNQLFWKIFCLSGENAFNIFNGVLFVTTIFLIAKLSVNKRFLLHPLPYFIILLYELYLIPDSDTLYYWAAGSFNYLFPSTLAAAFLLMLRWLDKRVTFSYLLAICVGGYSFLAGFTQEIYSLPISFSLFVVLSYKRFKVNKSLYIPILCYWIGTALVVFAPGTIQRIGSQGMPSDLSLVSALTSKVLQAFKIFHYGRLFYVILFALIYLAILKHHKFVEIINRYSFLLLCMFSSLSIVAIMGVGGRAVCGVEFFALLIILNYCTSLLHNEHKYENVTFVFVIVLLVHQVILLPFAKDSWGTYKEIVVKTEGNTSEIKTVSMKDWSSCNAFVDPFVAHPYRMMRDNIWMRSALYCEVCSEEVYNALEKGLDEYGRIGDDFILPCSPDLLRDIEMGNMIMELEPITSHFEGGTLFSMWHMFIQWIIPSRYPKEVIVSKDNVVELSINNKLFLRFESPYAPIPRKIKSVFCKE